MSRSGQGPRQRLKTAKGRKVSSTRWLERQLNDPYVKRAKAEGYRSRAAYKLLELDEKFGLLKGVKAVVDLGIAPGGWSQVVRKPRPQARRSPGSTCCRPTRSTASPSCRWISWTRQRLPGCRRRWAPTRPTW